MRDSVDPNDIARVVLKEFESWPKKRKPQRRSNGLKEWVPLSGQESLVCVAAATGMKCLPHSKLPQAQGVTLHDWHAEILVIRALNYFLLVECRSLAESAEYSSAYLRRRRPEEMSVAQPQPFAIQDNLRLHMYCSEIPCGDASMELTMAAQEDATPWIAKESPSTHTVLYGRSYFSHIGCIRRKPARPDAPPTLSKSCSDKLALKQFTSLLSAVTSLLIWPQDVYLTTLVLPLAQISESACTRAFHTSGRLAPLWLQGHPPCWPEPYSFKAFSLRPTTLEFAFSRRQVLQSHESLVPSNLASFSTPRIASTLIGGTLQGHKQFSPNGAAPVSRSQLWKLALHVAQVTDNTLTEKLLRGSTYAEVKLGDSLSIRRRVKKDVRSALGGDFGEDAWVKNTGDDDFALVAE